VERATIPSMLERRSSIAATVPISGALGPAGQQPADGRGDRCAQRLEVVAALERESDAGDAEPRRDTGYGPGSGLVAELGDGQLGERVRGMRVISRGDEDRGGPVGLDGGQQVLDPGRHERVVTVAGEADLYTAPELERALQGVIALGGTSVAVDLAEVSFIDSTTLGVLLRYHGRFRGLGGDLVLVTNDRRVVRTLEVTGLDRIFELKRDLAAAAAAIVPRSALPSTT